ncbi:MAG TPA: MEDS domain-containing protein, partial [Bacteroidia bacterium]|nr:MEDS domain-containing protein [Bacteroidia bacterium]
MQQHNKAQRSITVCGETLTGSHHICGFFDSREEQFDVILPFFKEGLTNNEEVITIWESNLHTKLRSKLSNAGLPVNESLLNGQLKILASEDTYIQDDVFVAQRMLDKLEKALATSQDGPHGHVRACGDMVWALKNLPGTDELMEYEAKINLLTPKYDCTLICMHNINTLSGRAIADLLASHPYVILHGKIHVNPHYIEPTELLKKFSGRRKDLLS